MTTSIHEELISKGYEHIHHDEYVEDYGDCESGPMVHYTPECDEYYNDEERIYVENNEIVHREQRDKDFEEYIERMGIECDNY